MLESWLLWHGGLGIRDFYICFDDENDSAISIAERYQSCYNVPFYRLLFTLYISFSASLTVLSSFKVTIVKNNAELRNGQKLLPAYAKLAHVLDTEVPARQQLNADWCLQLARKDGLEWLLHLDADELFYLRPPTTLKQHFDKLKEDKVGTIIYMNHEGVPELGKEDAGDVFHAITLFRKNLNSISLNSSAKQCIEFWQKRTPHGQYMISYDNGKAATRVVENSFAAGVHAWKIRSDNEESTPSQSLDTHTPETSTYSSTNEVKESLRNVSSLSDVRTLDLSALYKCEDACILHFVVCGLYWYLKKYKILDSFPNSWFGGKLQILPCFHLDSRDRFLKGDFEAMCTAYRQEVVLADEEMAKKQIESGVCLRVEGISNLILSEYKRIWSSDFHPILEAKVTADIMKRDSTSLPQDIDTKVTKDENLPLEKMWVLSSLVSQYLTTQSTEKKM